MIEEFGSIDVLVNNAGIVRDSLVLSMKEEDFEQGGADQSERSFLHDQTYLPPVYQKQTRTHHQHQLGHSGVMGNAGQANYASGKSRLIGLSQIRSHGSWQAG